VVKFLPENKLQFKTLSEDQERRLLTASPPYLRDMILFALNIGLRTNEIFNLKWEEVDIDRGAARHPARAVCILQTDDWRPVQRC
jgi:integrase